MPSPFPGMNPYLESPGMWPDFHEAFITALRTSLAPAIAPGFYAKIEEQLYIHEHGETRHRPFGRPDVGVVPTRRGGGVAVAEPLAVAEARVVTIPAHVDVLKLSSIRIFDRHSREVVTVIELLSPQDKYDGPDRDVYVFKRTRYFHSQTNLVEIDLLRGGPRHPWDGAIPCAYSAAVCRVNERPNVSYWPIQLRERLPVIPIPLRPDIPEPAVDLQELLHEVYDAAGYDGYIYDDGPPDPALSADDQAWADGLFNAPPGSRTPA